MASSLFGSNAKPQASNPFQAAMAAAQELKHSNPEQLMEKMMEANPQFAAPPSAVSTPSITTVRSTPLQSSRL